VVNTLIKVLEVFGIVHRFRNLKGRLLDLFAPASLRIGKTLYHGLILRKKGRQSTGPFGPFTFWRGGINHTHMNTDYHTTYSARQSHTAAAGSRTNLSAQIVAARSTKSLRIPATMVPAHPVLVGDREMLRKLRAAEMATWESMTPKATVDQAGPAQQRPTLWPLDGGRARRAESFLFLLLAVCGVAALLAGLNDVSELLNRWSTFMQGIENLLQ
jgi:hypothetical protein